jgi:hypothetical protein
MTQADSVHSTRRRFTPKIVGGIDHRPKKSKTETHTEQADLTTPHNALASCQASLRVIDDKCSAGILSPTAENGHLRQERHEVWRMADAATRYWRARLDFEDALSGAQRAEVPEGGFHPAVDPRSRQPMVEKYRAAIVRQLLTPAWDAASVKWKQMALARGQHQYTDVKSERIERVIADDLAFLAAHPVRIRNSETMARRRAFKEAMRRRIRDVAASRDLSEEEIKPVLKLKHHEIANFTEVHGVNLEWLLEGTGRIFKKDSLREIVRAVLDEAPAPIDQEA